MPEGDSDAYQFNPDGNLGQPVRAVRSWLRGLPDGADIDLDAWLAHRADRLQGTASGDVRLYRDFRGGVRDLACLLLADLSLSTDAWVGEHGRVIDVIRDALHLFAEALAATGDRHALYGFSSRRRDHVRLFASSFVFFSDEAQREPVRSALARALLALSIPGVRRLYDVRALPSECPPLPDESEGSLPQGDKWPLQDYLDRVEREAILEALEKTRFNRTAAAKLLGITFRSIRYRMERLGIE